MSHLGRPKGITPALSLKHIVTTVSELLGKDVIFASDCIGEDAKAKAAALKAGEVLLLENLRFHPEETQGDTNFAKALANLADVYINDAFGTAHRAHASTTIIAENFEENKAVGKLLQQEIEAIDKVLKDRRETSIGNLRRIKSLFKNYHYREHFR